MFKIIGADQKQYGPIPTDQIRQWISEGRVNGQTMACAEGTDEWKPLSSFPEFGFTAAPAPTAAPPAFKGPMTREEIVARDYSIDIMDCFSRGWTLYKENFGTMFVTFLIYAGLWLGSFLATQAVLRVVGTTNLPMDKQVYFGLFFVIIGSLVTGPAMGGVFHVYISLMRGQPAVASDLFTGYKSYFQDLFIWKLIFQAVTSASTLPYFVGMAKIMGPMLEKMKQSKQPPDPQEMIHTLLSSYVTPLPLLLIGLVPFVYVAVNLYFTAPLIVDKQMGVWTAMRTSWTMTHKHWLTLFGFVLLGGVINVPRVCTCWISYLFTMPLVLSAACHAYDDIFGRQNT